MTLHLRTLRSMPLAWHHCDNLSRSSWSARESSGVVIFKNSFKSSANKRKRLFLKQEEYYGYDFTTSLLLLESSLFGPNQSVLILKIYKDIKLQKYI